MPMLKALCIKGLYVIAHNRCTKTDTYGTKSYVGQRMMKAWLDGFSALTQHAFSAQ